MTTERARVHTNEQAKAIWTLIKSNDVFLNTIASAAQEFGATRVYNSKIDFVRDIYEVLEHNNGFPYLEIKETEGTDSLRTNILSFLGGNVVETKPIIENYVIFFNGKLLNNPTDEAKRRFCERYGGTIATVFGTTSPLIYYTDEYGVPYNPTIRSMIYPHSA